MILLLAALALVFVLAYFLSQRRDGTWERFRQRQRERARRTGPEQPIDPTFQFNEPASPRDSQQE
jgi:hypothetical protein